MLNKTSSAKVSNRKYLFDSVRSQTSFSNQYLLQLIFSTIITTLGLLTDNTVVVIGAMLISPLFWPVMGIALGIISPRGHLMRTSSFSLLKSVLMVTFFSYIITLVVPISDLSVEINSRINPNLIDLFIALATSIIGVLALYYPTISSSATGVAISISLLPPLCITGIGLAKGSNIIIGKSLLLFLTNIGAIVFTGVIVLWLLNIRPQKEEETKRFTFGFAISFLLMIILSIPLSFYLRQTINQNTTENQIKRVLNTEISKLSKKARIEDVDIDFLSLNEEVPLVVTSTVFLPEDVYMTQSQRDSLVEKLSALTQSEISLNFNIISTLSLQSEEDISKDILKKDIRQILVTEISNTQPDVSIDDMSITLRPVVTENQKQEVDILISVKQFNDQDFNFINLSSLKEFLENKLDIVANIEVELIPINRLKDSFIDSSTYKKLNTSINTLLEEVSVNINVSELDIKQDIVILKLNVPNTLVIPAETLALLEQSVKSLLGQEYSLQLQVFNYDLY